MFNAGNDTSEAREVWRLSFRSVEWMQHAVAAALALLTDEYNWNPSPDIDAETAGDFGIEVTESFLPVANVVGMVFPFAGIAANIPSGTLLCDGASYLRADYPDLFAAIGTTWGAADGTHFNVPDLRGVTLIGVGTGSGLTPRTLASFTGEETHTLTSSEMPSHNHSEGTTVPTAILIGEIPSVTVTGAVSVTGNTGGGGAHNNMQPSIALNYVIVSSPA